MLLAGSGCWVEGLASHRNKFHHSRNLDNKAGLPDYYKKRPGRRNSTRLPAWAH